MQTLIERRVGGETLSFKMDIAALEAIAEVEPRVMAVATELQIGHYKLVKTVIKAARRAAGAKPDDIHKWWDAVVEENGLKEMVDLAHDLYFDAVMKQSKTSGKDPAVVGTAETMIPSSTSIST